MTLCRRRSSLVAAGRRRSPPVAAGHVPWNPNRYSTSKVLRNESAHIIVGWWIFSTFKTYWNDRWSMLKFSLEYIELIVRIYVETIVIIDWNVRYNMWKWSQEYIGMIPNIYWNDRQNGELIYIEMIVSIYDMIIQICWNDR